MNWHPGDFEPDQSIGNGQSGLVENNARNRRGRPGNLRHEDECQKDGEHPSVILAAMATRPREVHAGPVDDLLRADTAIRGTRGTLRRKLENQPGGFRHAYRQWAGVLWSRDADMGARAARGLRLIEPGKPNQNAYVE